MVKPPALAPISPTLDELLPQPIQELFRQCLAEVVGHGFGFVHVVIEKGEVRFIRPEPSYSAIDIDDNGVHQA